MSVVAAAVVIPGYSESDGQRLALLRVVFEGLCVLHRRALEVLCPPPREACGCQERTLERNKSGRTGFMGACEAWRQRTESQQQRVSKFAWTLPRGSRTLPASLPRSEKWALTVSGP